ncbi:pro-epidermal growth factor isoform X2 [Pelobates fuscus]|uniref:pro-epidermal growth factor isoform X2 n=1 Tax=Pelobates fuscus TaxID=191477 RepID=UPI002FE4649F
MYLILTVLWSLFLYVDLLHTEGLQQWDCQEGNQHLANGKSACNALMPSLIFNNGKDIFSINTDGTNLRKIVTNAGSPVLLDFDQQEQRLYWLDRNRGFLQRMYLNGTKRERMRAIGRGVTGFTVDCIHKQIFWTNRQKRTIEFANTTGKKSQVILRNLFNPILIAIDSMEGLLFWSSEGPLYTIQRANLSGNNMTSVIEAKGEIKSLTLDTMDKRIYWLVFERKTGVSSIGSCTYNGDLTLVLKYIVISSRQSVSGFSLFSDHIYYSEWNSGSIRRVNKYSGKDTTTIILKPTISEIGNLLVVPPEDVFNASYPSHSSGACTLENNYCSKMCEKTTDSQHCKCMEGYTLSANGRNCEDINECALWNHGCTLGCENIPGSYYCTCPKGYVLLPDNRSCHDKVPCSVDYKDCRYGCIQTSGGPLCHCPEGSVFGKDGKTCTGCSSPDNGGCSQICSVSSPGKWECDCFPGYNLQLDKKRCLASGPRPFLIFTNLHDIQRINFDGTGHEILLDSQMGRVIALDYDPIENRIYFAHTALKWIESANIDGSERERVISEDLDLPEGIAIDTINRKLYWTDRGKSCIEMSDINGKNREKIIQKDIEQPRGISVHPLAKKLFWTDTGAKPRIESSNLDGSGRMVLVSSDLVWPTGITVEFLSDKLYWCDAKRSVIESSNLDGSERQTLSQNEVGHPFHITVFEDHMWITDWLHPSITRMDKRNKGNMVRLQGSMQRPSATVVVHPMAKPVNSEDIFQIRKANVVCNETKTYESFVHGPLPPDIHETGKNEDSLDAEGLVTEIVVTDERPCMESHCDINAHCVLSEVKPKCQCLEGFDGNGQLCDDINECALHIASCDQHHAECINTEGGYICKCKDGFIGNGLKCIESSTNASTFIVITNNSSGNGYSRECPKSHEGYCLNGGVCSYLISPEDYSCRCLPGYVGERCQYDDLEWWAPRSMQIKIRNVTIAVSLTVLILVLGLGSFAIYFYRHQMYQRKSPYKPEAPPDASAVPNRKSC